MTYLATMYPNQVSGVENYSCEIEVYIHCDPTNSQAYELRDMIEPILAKGATTEVNYNTACNIDVLRILYATIEG